MAGGTDDFVDCDSINEVETVDPIADPNKIDNIAALNRAMANIIAAIEKATFKPKPRYKLDEQEFDWAMYMKMLTDTFKALIELRQKFGRARVIWLGQPRRNCCHG